MKENWGDLGGGEKEEEEVNIQHILVHNLSYFQQVVRVETEHQVALLAPKESQAFKNSMNGVGKMTYRQVSLKYDSKLT